MVLLFNRHGQVDNQQRFLSLVLSLDGSKGYLVQKLVDVVYSLFQQILVMVQMAQAQSDQMKL